MATSLTSITGLQNLTNLRYFRSDETDSALSSIDVSGLTALEYLNVGDNENLDDGSPSLTSINVTGCNSLRTLYADTSDFFETGLPDISGISTLEYIDFDSCELAGSFDFSGFPALIKLDLNNNLGITEVIISSSQPLGYDQYDVNLSGCSLTQSAVDNILIALSENEIEDGYVYLDGGNNAVPSEEGVAALRVLNNKSWYISVESYHSGYATTISHETSGDACNDDTYSYTVYAYGGSGVVIGNFLYQDSNLFIPVADGWYHYETDGVSYQVSGGLGEITSAVACA